MNQVRNENAVRLSWRMSWDTILFIFLWSAQFWSSELSGALIPTEESTILIPCLTRIWYYDPAPAFLLLALFAYVLADLLLEGRFRFAIKLVALAIVIVAFVVLPTMAAIIFRHNTAPHLYIHDGAIQTEEAIKFLLAGKNPYAESYAATPMGQWRFNELGGNRNPALDHLPYLPFTFLSAVPLYLATQATLGWYDQRLMSLILLLLAVLFLLRIGCTSEKKLAAVMLVALNPLFVPFFIEGRNDVVIYFWLIGALLFLQCRRVGWAGVWLACAAASKQTAWFMLPFFALYVLNPATRQNWRDLARRARALIPALILFAAIVAPFGVWNPAAFIEDVINYQSGISSGPTNYPIKSLGLGSLVLGFHLVKNSTGAFPFWTFQILLGGLTLVGLLVRQWRNNTISQMAMNYAIWFFVAAFFSRTFNDNHLGFALTCLVLPSFLSDAAPAQPVSRVENK